MKEVWLVGNKNPNVDKSLTWNGSLSNLSDPDILIMDFQSLQNSLDLTKLYNSKSEIFNKFLNGGSLISLIPENFENIIDIIQFFSPINYSIEQLETKKILYRKSNNFYRYLEKNDKSNFIIQDFQINDDLRNIHPTNQLSQQIVNILEEVHGGYISKNPVFIGKEVLANDNSNNIIAVRLWLHINGYWKSGNLILLPSIKSLSKEEVIDLLLESLGKTSNIETMPEWVYNIKLNGVDEILNKMKKLLEEKRKIEENIKENNKEKIKLENYYRLIVSKGNMLEQAVFEALKLMGFHDIRQERDHNLEDGIFDLKSISNYSIGVIEVKGSDTRTSLGNMTQCNRWSDDYYKINKPAKGIFIPNQFRLDPYPESKQKRLHFEPNELTYSKSRDICIIPSCVIFNAVEKILKGVKVNREKIEKQISDTKGVIDNIDLN